jgi:hypothetical protein
MSASQDWIDNRIVNLQAAINEREIGGALFELKDLVSHGAWNELGNLQNSVTKCFKKRITGFSDQEEPCLTNIQVRRVRQNGRERMFQRIDGNNDPASEEQPFEGAI